MLLAGDVGGTNTRLALYELVDGHPQERWKTVLDSRAIVDFPSSLRAALGARRVAVSSAAFGVAGPVRARRAKVTNLSWYADALELERSLELKDVGLLNDLEANAWGVPLLEPSALLVLQPGASDAKGNQALCSPGTGLGEAGLYFDGRQHRPFACEGGHASFSPRDELEVELWRYLAKEHGHVSWERVVSGPGLVSLYTFLRDSKRGEEPPGLAERVARGGGAEIAKAAQEGNPLATRALDRFVSLMGAECGNLALKIMSTGGLYVGGGIAPKLASWIARGAFLEAFLDKGRMSALLKDMPVKLILDDSTALRGAARFAALLAEQQVRA